MKRHVCCWSDRLTTYTAQQHTTASMCVVLQANTLLCKQKNDLLGRDMSRLPCRTLVTLLGLAGITLSQKQVQRGTQLAAERGLSNVKFRVRLQRSSGLRFPLLLCWLELSSKSCLEALRCGSSDLREQCAQLQELGYHGVIARAVGGGCTQDHLPPDFVKGNGGAYRGIVNTSSSRSNTCCRELVLRCVPLAVGRCFAGTAGVFLMLNRANLCP
eukprot:GHRQ01031092.1.p1 GENE.GHRQ01031092.1~~GHRQ01031092.1.p1  ORF type:complete len:215 (+),score=24.69 GHRQ01031092.1:118-762(+)